MNVKISQHPRHDKRLTVKLDVTNQESVQMGINTRSRTMRAAFIATLITVMFPKANTVEIVYHHTKRGVSNSGFKAAVWVDV